jgi:hypothetical protein
VLLGPLRKSLLDLIQARSIPGSSSSSNRSLDQGSSLGLGLSPHTRALALQASAWLWPGLAAAPASAGAVSLKQIMRGMLGSDSTLSLGSGEVEESLRLSVLSELCLRTLALLELELEPRTKAGAKAKAWDT